VAAVGLGVFLVLVVVVLYYVAWIFQLFRSLIIQPRLEGKRLDKVNNWFEISKYTRISFYNESVLKVAGC
jgi:hypothetical protein